MRRIILAIAAAVIGGTVAHAADKAGPASVASVQAAGETLPFHGLYIGGAVGAASGAFKDSDGFKVPREGLTASAIVGYNHRLPGIVLGIEGDIGVTDVRGSTSIDGFRIEGSSKALGSVRARVGRVFGDLMVYATGGVAMTNAKLSDGIDSVEKNRINGLVYGLGAESFLFGNVGIRLEALRYDWDAFRPSGLDDKVHSHDTHVRAALIVRM